MGVVLFGALLLYSHCHFCSSLLCHQSPKGFRFRAVLWSSQSVRLMISELHSTDDSTKTHGRQPRHSPVMTAASSCLILPHLASFVLPAKMASQLSASVTSHALCAPLCSRAVHLAPMRVFSTARANVHAGSWFFSISMVRRYQFNCGITGGSS